MNTKTTVNTEYFAALTDHKQLAAEMTEKIRIWRKWCDEHGLNALWKKKLINYYGNSQAGNSSQAVTQGGQEGELAMIKVNDMHALVQEQLVIVTSQRPAGNARAIKADTKCLKAAKLGSAVSEYYMVEKDFETQYVNATEKALVVDEAFVEIYWDRSLGNPIAVDPETGIPETQGDGILRVHCPWLSARDPGIKIEENKWLIFSFKGNKFDLAATYPKFAEYILHVSDDDTPDLPMDAIPDGSDQIWQHLLIHDKTAAVREGRYSLMVGTEIIFDMTLPYKDFPVDRITAADVIEGCLGYAPVNDVMGLEQVTDALHSVVVTNQTTFGGQCLVGPEESNIKQADLGKGVRYFEMNPEMIQYLKPLDMLHTPGEIFNYINMLGQKKERAVGSVQTQLAQQASQGASGSSMALIQTQSISFNSGIQRAYFKLLSRSMTKFIRVLQVYADTEMVAAIAGKQKGAWVKEFKFTGEDLNPISSVIYELINPIAQTFGGRLTFAQDLLKAGQIKSPKQYINVATTGNVDLLTEDDEADGLLILEENEWLAEGKPFKAIITQIHADHIKSHTSQITLDAQATDPEFVARTLAHIQEHINVWMQASVSNPGILMATDQQSLQPAQQPGMPPAGMPPQQQPPPQHPGALQMGKTESAPPRVIQKAEEVRQPSLPSNPVTGQKPMIPGVTDAAS